jgi:hypothetical protein
MTGRQRRLCTEYKSLYPTDSANREVAIRRIASNANHGDEGTVGVERRPFSPEPMVVHRHFEPRPDFSDDLVKALYQLLVHVEDGHTSASTSGPIRAIDSTCISGHPE